MRITRVEGRGERFPVVFEENEKGFVKATISDGHGVHIVVELHGDSDDEIWEFCSIVQHRADGFKGCSGDVSGYRSVLMNMV